MCRARQADEALVSYRRCIQRIRESEILQKLTASNAINERFPPRQQEFNRFYARMGIGLHYGMAVEGAVGSAAKIDASYLGIDVDLSDVLEEQTKEYKTPILMSQAFYDQLSENWQQTCRRVDRVRWEGLSEPFDIYAANVASVEGNYFDPSIREDVHELELTVSQTAAFMTRCARHLPATVPQ